MIRAVLRRDLSREVRRGGLAEPVLFAVAAALAAVFALPPTPFALPPTPRLLAAAAPGIFWTVLLFATLLAAARRSAEAARSGVLEVLVGAGVSPARIFFAEAVSLFLSALAVALVLGAAVVGFTAAAVANGALLAATVLLGAAGLSLAATALALLTRTARRREVLFPVLFLPVVLPVVLPAAAATAAALEGGAATKDPATWLLALAGFDLVLASLFAAVANDLVTD